ncbi:dehypoxanthine futalosine cyclase [Telmatocola sphagniphila]|uniref:Cyclic dehypoxanthine futalosine synthase n=1 Tax=Telmatocola sphagniphila TaxID=1123043 RepID=A0A8E6B7V6_9BACT|nr:cyclic dehypoxanthinyl futalosine synthase [Telmatocola sphagniphila]QVL32030.1 dehypoxanthine futalosine cyclase [Telmatocola sphagniphila]
MNTTIQRILSKAADGERISFEEGVQLFDCQDLHALGRVAHQITTRLHPEPYRTYNIDRNINYTNVCAAVCDFCAFYRKSADEDAYVLSREELYRKFEETIALGGDQVLMQGGMHPSLKLEWYEELLRDLKSRYPQVNLHAFSPPEIWHFHKINKLPLKTVLERLKAAGLGSLPGGGGEILVDRVRKELTKGKALTQEWLEVNRQWHLLGGRSTCTMMFGHIETLAERVEHLDVLRKLQDETKGFTAFICWTMQPGHKMAHFPAHGSFDYLKTQAISRIYLDNIPNIQSSWVTQGLKIGQVALFYGANDMGSLMIEENVVASAGTVHYLTLDQIKNAIREAGYIPRQRNVFYEYIDEKPRANIAPAPADSGLSLPVVA